MSIQVTIIIAYFAIVTAIGLCAARATRGSDDFLLAGRKMGIFMCATAIAGEWIGGTSTIGIAEGGFNYGISAAWYSIANAIGTVLLAFTLARLYRKSERFTVTGFMESYYDETTRIIASIVLAFVMIVVGSVQIVAGGALVTALTGLAMPIAIVATGIVFLVYTLAGGLWAIGYTNIIHMVVMYLGLIIGLASTWVRAGGMASLRSALPAQPFFSATGAGTSNVTAWISASVLAALVAQAAIQPVMAARDEATAQRGTLLAVVFVAPAGVICALLGMFSRTLLPNASAKTALPTLMMTLPPWTGGLVLAGILAAILSTVAPCILAAGTLLAKDIYQAWLRPSATEAEVYRVSRLMTLISGLLAMGWAMYCPVILDQVYFAYTLRATIAILVVLGVYWRGVSKKSGKWALVLTAPVAVLWEVFKTSRGAYPFGMHPMYSAALVTLSALFVASLLEGKPAAKRRGLR